MLKKEVLRKKADFSLIYNRGKSVNDRYVVLFYRKNGLSYNRRAFLASKKVGNSVRRNRARRLVRESFNNIEKKLKKGYDIVIIARNSINDKSFSQVDDSLIRAFNRSGLMKGSK